MMLKIFIDLMSMLMGYSDSTLCENLLNVGRFLRAPRFPLPIKLTAMI
jgi:hypothetical protein